MKQICLLAFSALVLSSCASVMATGVGTVATASMEERSLGDNFDDRTISAEIHHLFVQEDVNELLSDVSVRVHEGRVLLTGRTASREVALEAVRLAWQAAGVREVINEIKAGEDGTDIFNYAQDNFVEAQIEARLLATKDISSVNYTVEYIDGTAYLLGVAKDAEERKSAAYIASITEGVDRVVSYVRLKDHPVRKQQIGNPPSDKQNRKRGIVKEDGTNG